MTKCRIKSMKKLIMQIVPVALIIAMVCSACGKKDLNTTEVANPDGSQVEILTDADGNPITEPEDPYAALFSMPRPEFDWRENVYKEFSLDFKLEENEPYHIFDINSVDGRVIAVAKLNTDTDENDTVNFSLTLIDNDNPDDLTLLEMPGEVNLFANSAGTGISIIDCGYSGLKVCYDGGVLGEFYGTVCYVNAEGSLEMSGVRYMTRWDKDGKLLWNTDISEYLTKEYGFVKYANLLSNGRTVVFTECDSIYGFVLDTDGTICAGREIDDKDALYYVSDIEATAGGKDVVFYNCEYKEYLVDEAADTDATADEASDETSNETEDEEEYDHLFVEAAFFDADNISVTEEAVIPYEFKKNDYYSVNRGSSRDFIYSNEIGVFSFNVGENKATPVMNYVNSDFRGYYFTDVAAIDNDKLMGIFTTYDEGIMIAAGFEAVSKNTLADIQTVKLGVYGANSKIKRLVREYNNSHSDYRIVIEDYALLGAEKLYTDILERTGPDLVMIAPDMLDFAELAQMGLLVEFEELAEEDVEISGANGDKLDEAYLMNVMDAYAIDGKHYLYMYDFYYNIFTGRASSSILPSNTGWSIIDFDITYSPYHVGGTSLMAYDLNNAPVMIAYKTRTQFVDIMTRYTGSEFVNMDTGLCEFDSEDFISLLKYAGSLAVSNDDSLPVYSDISVSYRNDSVLINENLLGMGTPEGFWSDMCRNFDGDFSCIGFPSRSGNAGNSGTISMAELPIAIIRNGNVDGAWSFAREFFCDKYQNGIINRGCGIPVLKDSFDAWFSEGMSRSAGLYCVDESGNNVFCPNTYIAEGQYCTVSYMMEDDALLVKESIIACDEREFTNPVITQIIKEETDRFFAGGITAEETAANIQKRVTEYLEEQ